MFVPIRFTCCFYCSTNAIKTAISDLLDNLPPDAWLLVRDRMLLPVMRRLPKMNGRWADLAQPLPPCPSDRDQARCWELCRMVRQPPPDVQFFEHFYALASALKPKDQVWLQLNLARNNDVILKAVTAISGSTRKRERPQTVSDIAECGALPYALMLAHNLRGRRRSVMQDFARQVEEAIERENHIRLLVVLAARGSEHTLSVLNADILRMIVGKTRAEIVLMEEVLKDYVEHDLSVCI